MQDFTITVVSKTNHTHDYVVYALDMDAAIDKLLDKISYDISVIYAEDECILF